MPNEFSALLGDLGDMQKSLDTDTEADKAAAAAAAEGAGGTTEAEIPEAENQLLKSLTVTIDGKEVEVFEGSDMLKALAGELSEVKGVVLAMGTLIKGFAEERTKSREMVKSLQEEVVALGKSPAGRKTVLSVAEKRPSAGAAAPAIHNGMHLGELMAKAIPLIQSGKIDAGEAAFFESRVNRENPMSDPRFAAIVRTINS